MNWPDSYVLMLALATGTHKALEQRAAWGTVCPALHRRQCITPHRGWRVTPKATFLQMWAEAVQGTPSVAQGSEGQKRDEPDPTACLPSCPESTILPVSHPPTLVGNPAPWLSSCWGKVAPCGRL